MKHMKTTSNNVTTLPTGSRIKGSVPKAISTPPPPPKTNNVKD